MLRLEVITNTIMVRLHATAVIACNSRDSCYVSVLTVRPTWPLQTPECDMIHVIPDYEHSHVPGCVQEDVTLTVQENRLGYPKRVPMPVTSVPVESDST